MLSIGRDKSRIGKMCVTSPPPLPFLHSPLTQEIFDLRMSSVVVLGVVSVVVVGVVTGLVVVVVEAVVVVVVGVVVLSVVPGVVTITVNQIKAVYVVF